MPSFETPTDVFTRLSVFGSPKGSSNTFKNHKNVSLYFKRRFLIIYKYQNAAFRHAMHCRQNVASTSLYSEATILSRHRIGLIQHVVSHVELYQIVFTLRSEVPDCLVNKENLPHLYFHGRYRNSL